MHVVHLLLLLVLGFLPLMGAQFGYLPRVGGNLLFVALLLELCRSQIRVRGNLRIHMINITGGLQFLSLVRDLRLRLVGTAVGVRVGLR